MGSGLASPLSALHQDTAEELLAERDAKIRELEETIKMLQVKFKECEMENPAQETELPMSQLTEE